MSATLYSLGEHLRTSLQAGSIFAILAAFAFGVFVGFTPCVYPILPITVTYIGSIARGSKLNGFIYSLIYVLGMAIVYATIGVITAITGGQIGRIWNNGWVLLALANFFILLALWQLKVVQIPVPQIIRGAGPRRNGALGALLVGGASGLVVGPCTLPGLAAMVTLIAAGAHGGSAGSLGAVFVGIVGPMRGRVRTDELQCRANTSGGACRETWSTLIFSRVWVCPVEPVM